MTDNQNADDTSHLDDIPVALLEFKILLHPTRLAIMTLLYQHYRLSSAEVRKLLNLPWGTFDTHLKRLQREKYLKVKRDIYNGSPMIVLYLTAEGEQRYREFKQVWDSIQT